MENMEIIKKRISCRAYEDKPLEEDLINKLNDYIEEINGHSDVRFVFVYSSQKGINVIKMSEAMFSGNVYAYVAAIGADDDTSAEQIGYYGEKIVLYATALGLGTCWVASTYDRKSVRINIDEKERLWDVIPIGYPAAKTPVKQKLIRNSIRAKDRKKESFLLSDKDFSEIPEWLRAGIESIKDGPSAINGQPVNISWKDNKVSAVLTKNNHGLEYNDLGIAKANFEYAAACYNINGKWEWGNNGEFVI